MKWERGEGRSRRETSERGRGRADREGKAHRQWGLSGDGTRGLSRGDVKTRLMYLVFHIAGALLSLISQNFGQNALEGIRIGFAHVLRGRDQREKVGVGDVERGAVAVRTLCCGVAVAGSQLRDVGICAQNGGDD